MLVRYPDYYVDLGTWTSHPTGSEAQREVGRIVDEVQALGKARDVDTSRLMASFRNDVYVKRSEGTPACTVCDGRGECFDYCTWEGAMTDAPFDPGWIVTIPRSEHRWAVDRIWGGDETRDPWSPKGARLWPEWVDREAIAAVNTEDRVAALYGPVKDRDQSMVRTDYAFNVSAALMDMREPGYRAWAVKKMIADLQVMGIDPGERAAIQYAYKPGWHVYFEGGDSGARCSVAGAHMWTGPANPCAGMRPPGGPFARTPYGPGEFEKALNAMLLEMRAGLVAAGFGGVSIVTVERPTFGDEKWAILEPAVRNAAWLIGELASSCDRKDLRRAPNPLRCRGGRENPRQSDRGPGQQSAEALATTE